MHRQSGRTLLEVLIASGIAVVLFGLAMPVSVSSIDNFDIAERRAGARTDLHRALAEIERALRRTDREGNLPAIRLHQDLTDPSNLTLEPSTAGGALFLNQYQMFDPATKRGLYADAVAFYVAPDPQNGGNALYRRTWTNTLNLLSTPTRTDKIAIGVISPLPFVDDGTTVRVTLGISRKPVKKDLPIEVWDSVEVHID